MIISFYDEKFRALKDNSGLVIDNSTYSLVKRPVDMNDFSCKCEAFTEDLQPTFFVVRDNKGSKNLIYSGLAGILLLNDENQTEVNGTDIKSMLSSDILVTQQTYTTVNDYLIYIFHQWNVQVNQGSFDCELIFNDNVGTIELTDLKQKIEEVYEKVNAWEEIQSYLKFYDLFMDTSLDLINKKVNFIIGKSMYKNLNIKLWEYGIKNYGKWVADTNETQGYYLPNGATSIKDLIGGFRWILTSQNKITLEDVNRDIYPIKKKVIISNNSLEEANREALAELLNSLYNENIDIPTQTITPDFETNFAIYVKQGEEKYKDLPCGELRYDATGLISCQIGYRYTDVNYI